MQRVGFVIQGEGVCFPVQGESSSGDAIGESADGRAEIVRMLDITGEVVIAEGDVGALPLPIRGHRAIATWRRT